MGGGGGAEAPPAPPLSTPLYWSVSAGEGARDESYWSVSAGGGGPGVGPIGV